LISCLIIIGQRRHELSLLDADQQIVFVPDLGEPAFVLLRPFWLAE
jgi:hypothetical protein